MMRSVKGTIFSVDEMATHDGPGLRMTVYLKGCPLECIWCHSPESISPRPQVVWYRTKCKKCGTCIEVCPEGLRSMEPVDSKDREGCRLCRTCVRECPSDALEVKGAKVTAGEIVDHAAQLTPFFRSSGGGITLTGGEPTLQEDFSFAILSLCRERDIHTAMETCGFAPWEKYERLAQVTSLFLYDLKHPDDELHRRYTGAPNGIILDNLKGLLDMGAEVAVRMPLIPEFNDSVAIVRSMGLKALEMGARKMTLLPFNPASRGKFSWLHRAYPLGDVKRQSDEYVAMLEKILREEGLEVVPS